MRKCLSLLLLLLLAGCTQVPDVTEPTVPAPPITAPPTTEQTVPPTTQPPVTGWVEEKGVFYFHDDRGIPVTGWLELEGDTYYFHPDGTMAKGETELDGQKYHFTSRGRRVILANPWNEIPADYEPQLVTLPLPYGVEGSMVDASCYEDLTAMIDACNRQCPQAMVVSSYRTYQHQTDNFNRKVQFYIDQGFTPEQARANAAQIIAVPGTSEHQLGLAVDIIDTRLWALEWEQADLPAQKWLMEHSWEYGFILRYPRDKTDITGITFEPWHYRYVGKELAAELHSLGLTLEEYLQELTP